MTKLNPALPLTIQSFSSATISYNVGKPNSVGRSFTISFKDTSGVDQIVTVKFKELVDQFCKLSKKENNTQLIQEAYSKLKTANRDANRILDKQSGWYQFRTGFHRLSNLFRKDHDVLLDKALTKKSIKLPKATKWYDDIISKLPDYRSLNSFSESLQRKQGTTISATWKTLASKHPELKLMGFCMSNGKGTNSFTMQGLAIIASYLKQKHQLKNLHVCGSFESFQAQLKQIAENPEDIRASFIVGVKGMGVNSWIKVPHQHKATIAVEKKAGQLKIIYLDGEAAPIVKYPLDKSAKEITGMQTEAKTDGTPVFWSILHSGIDMANVELFHSKVKRGYGAYGCETIALRDAVDFLNSPNFFERIRCAPNPEIPGIAEVNWLPPRFMKTTQSTKSLKEYIENNRLEAEEEIKKSSSEKTSLKRAIKNNTAMGLDKNGVIKEQNHFVSYRSLRYHLMLLEAMRQLTTDQLKEIIADTFLQVDPPSLKMGDEPKTLGDLYAVYWTREESDRLFAIYTKEKYGHT